SDPHSLGDNGIYSIFEDRSGVLWIGTLGRGLNTFDLESRRFTQYQRNTSDPNSLSHNYVMSIHETQSGMLWIGTRGGGLNRLDRENQRFTRYRYDETDPNSLSHDTVYSIYEDPAGVLWAGTGGGLNSLDRENGKFRRYQHDTNNPESLSGDSIRAIYEDHGGVMWVGTQYSGLNVFDRSTGKFTRYQNDPEDPNSLGANSAMCFYQDRSGVLWVGTFSGGLNRFDEEKKQFTRYMPREDNPNSLTHEGVMAIHEDSGGIFWLATYGGGLNRFDRAGGQFKAFREKDGLANDVVYGLLADSRGNLWMSTNKGLSMFNPKTQTFKNFDVDDGLQSNEFNDGAYFKNKKGEMFFGGINGLNAFLPELITDSSYQPPVVITNFLLLNKPVPLRRLDPESPLEKTIEESDSLTLSYKHYVVSFDFSALHYAAPKKNRYSYTLEGFDREWFETGSNNRRATYTNLPSGNFTFRVRGTNKDGTWNNRGTSLKISVLPPPWATWWAYTLYLLALAALVARFLRSKQILAQKVKERTKELNRQKEVLEIKHQILMDTQSQLVQAEKMAGLGTLVAGVAHEINNPTNFTHAGAFNLERDLMKFKRFLVELAGEEADDEVLEVFDEKFSTLFKHLSTLQEGTIRIKEIVKSLRTFSRLDEADMKYVPLLEGLETTLHLVRANYRHKVEFICDFQVNPRIECYPAELNQVFMNLMVNACQSIAEKQKSRGDEEAGTLTLQTRQEGDQVVIRFEDSGTGMSEEVRQKIFDPFFTTKEVGEGTGLGLSISFGIIRKHGGYIDVSSQEGEGTAITLYLPLKKGDTPDDGGR
ncbi:MAG: hypothetical protein GY940_29175, partial [bacterium]|nr:hypothetical protein [bacterium]